MTNFERMMTCKTPEEFAYIFSRLKTFALYANGKLLNQSPSDFLEWLNKENNSLDATIIFDTSLRPCPECGSIDIKLVTLSEEGEWIEINKGDSFSHCHYRCPNCGYMKLSNDRVIGSDRWSENQIEALLVWNF